MLYSLFIAYLIDHFQPFALANVLRFGDGVLETTEDLGVELLWGL